jgi:hypothetical protein
MRTKLHLTDKELMQSSWISLCLQSADFPYYKHNGKQSIKVSDPAKIEEIFSKKKKQ